MTGYWRQAFFILGVVTPALAAAPPSANRPDPTLIQSSAALQERIKTQLKVTRPDYVVFVPEVTNDRVSDTGNEHFLVFDGPDGSLMAIWTQSTSEGQPDQHIAFVQSRDEGVTWSRPRIIAGPAKAGGGRMASWAFPLVSRSGRIYVLYSQNVGKFDTFPHATGRLDGIYSDDHGRTWSPPQTVAQPRNIRDNPDPSFPGNWICWQKPLRLTRDGRYLAGVTRWTSLAVKKNPTSSWISHDSVVEFIRFENIDRNPEVRDIKITWLAANEKAITVPFPGHPEVSACQEPSIVKLPDGRLFCVMRTSAGSPFWTSSDDDGQTWSPAQRLLRCDDGEPLLHPLSPCPIYDVGGNAAGSGRYALFIHNHDGHYHGYGPTDTGYHRRPVYLVPGRYQAGARQPVWFDEPRYFMDHGGLGLGPPKTRGRFDLALYASFTFRGGKSVLWYPDRKFFLLGRVIGPEWLRPRPQESRESRDARMRWWREARFGMFIHWGLYALAAGEWKGQRMPEIGEWIMSKYQIPIAEYEKLAARFNPVKFDADAWARLAKRAGMRYMVITSKHHDGFAMFRSASDRYNIADATPFRRDPIRELAEACRRHGLRFGVYYSQALDWHEPDAGGTEPWLHLNAGCMTWGNAWDFPNHAEKRFDRYFAKKVKPQLRELLTGYGPLGVIWFDTPFTISREQSEELYNLVRELQPGCIMNSRLGNGLGDYQSAGDNRIPSRGVLRDWETPATINRTWGYKSFDQEWKSPETLVRNLIDIASKGGNYLLNVGPTPEGEIPGPSVERLEQVGRWLDINGEAIYATAAGPFEKPLAWGRATQKPGRLFLHVFDWPRDGKLAIALANRSTRAYLLARPGEPLPCRADAAGLEITLPPKAPDPIASVVVVEIDGPARAIPRP
jgi:alpha-L-fucosidase